MVAAPARIAQPIFRPPSAPGLPTLSGTPLWWRGEARGAGAREATLGAA